jgi:hypothetical protein
MRDLVKSVAGGRIGAGLAMLVKPELVVRDWIGRRPAEYGGTQMLTRAFGARDLALGAGTLASLSSGGDARDWVIAATFADLTDFVATAIADDIPFRGRAIVFLLAGTAIAVGAGYLLSEPN